MNFYAGYVLSVSTMVGTLVVHERMNEKDDDDDGCDLFCCNSKFFFIFVEVYHPSENLLRRSSLDILVRNPILLAEPPVGKNCSRRDVLRSSRVERKFGLVRLKFR